MADHRIAITKLLKFEGGYVNDLDDKGGETYKGITRKNWPEWSGWAIIDEAKNHPNFPSSLKLNVSLNESVISFYRSNYWNKIGGDKIKDQSIADSFLDQAVLEGIGTAIKREEEIAHLSKTGKITDQLITKLNQLV